MNRDRDFLLDIIELIETMAAAIPAVTEGSGLVWVDEPARHRMAVTS